MDRSDVVAGFRKTLRVLSDGDPAARAAASECIDETLAPLDRAERVSLLKDVRDDLEADYTSATGARKATGTDRIDVLTRLRKEVEGDLSGDDLVAREAARVRLDEILAPIDDVHERIAILKEAKADVDARYADRQRRLDTLLLAVTGYLEVGDEDVLLRLRLLERSNAVFSLVRPAEHRRAFAATGLGVVRCGRPDIGLDPFADAVRMARLLPEGDDLSRLNLDDDMIRAAIGGLHQMARWAFFGFNVFSPSVALAAKLVLTDVPDDVAPPPLPYDTFVIALPDGVIPFFVGGDPASTRKEWADSIWVHRAVVASGCEPIVRVSVAWRRFAVSRQVAAPTSALGSSPRPGDHLAPEDEVAIEGAWRLARNFLLWLDASGGLKKHRPTSVPRKLQEKRARSGSTWPTEWEFGREVTITPELREAAREAVAGRTRRHAADGWHLRSRFIVRGHWRNQAHGEGRALRRRQWVQPFWKGPEGAKAWSHLYEGKG